MHFVLNQTNTVANNYLMELRSKELQKDRMRFRRNMERIGEIMAYEISKSFSYRKETIETPLALASENVITEYPVLLTVLRAGMPFFQGFLNFFDRADAGFIGAYREEGDGDIKINLEYMATVDIENKTVLMIDPMLATGRSVMNAVKVFTRSGMPRHLHITSLVASPEGIRYVERNLKIPHTLWTGAIDEKLDERFYIVPGLGDAGDLSYGAKI